MKIILLIFLMIPMALADIKSEEKAIDEFYFNEYLKKENFLPNNRKYYFPLNPLFKAKLLKDTKSLKYFLIAQNYNKWMYMYKKDRAFAIFWETKFSGIPLTKEDVLKVFYVMGEFILDHKDLPAQKKALNNPVESEAYFQIVLTAISKKDFK